MNNQLRCIAHEIRNQISICELYSQIIKRNIEKENIENKSIDNALNCISKALKIMSNNLIDLKSIENCEKKEIKICELVRCGIDLASVYVQEKDINIVLSCIDDAIILADENKFLACIVNIIKNSIEAIEEKGEIRVSVEKINKNMSVKISNNGPAISTQIQKHIFEEGYTTKKTGSGLGLPICAQNLKTQNAILRLNKSNSQITEFEIIIPIDNIN